MLLGYDSYSKAECQMGDRERMGDRQGRENGQWAEGQELEATGMRENRHEGEAGGRKKSATTSLAYGSSVFVL